MKHPLLPSILTISLSLALAGCNNESIQNSPNVDGKGAQLEPGGYMYFFEQDVPQAITTTSAQSLAVTNRHYKDGAQSLRWQFDPTTMLTFHQAIGYSPEKENAITPQTFTAWIYNEKPIDDSLLFEFGTDDSTQAKFHYQLNFKGWRGIAVPYRDMQGQANANMNRLRIIAPKASGTIYFDQMMMSVPVDNRWPTADYQQPFVNPTVVDMASKNWTALMMYDEMLKEHHATFDFTVPFDDTSGDTANLYKQFDQYLAVNPHATITQQQIDKNLASYQKFALTQNTDGSWQGKPLDHPKRQNYLKTGILDDATLAMVTDTANIRDLGKILLESAKFLRSESLSNANRTALEKAFINAVSYSFDQGWQGGSGLQVITHVGYQTREYFDALFIARQLLAQHHLLQSAQQSMMWFNATGRIYETDQDITASNVDILNTQLQWMIKSFLLLPNSSERHDMLQQLQTWLSKTLLASDGLGGGFKPDGSIFHHSQHYPAYGKDAFSGLAGAVFGLSNSPYQITPQAHSRIKDALLKMRIYTKETNTPIVLSGRHPDGKQKITATPFKWLALAGSPDQTHLIDPELAAAFANLTNKTEFEGIKAENEPVGSWAMNYASMAVVRGSSHSDTQKSWLATARGFSRYLVGNETYAANNLYGRYLQYGQLEITPADYSLRAFSHDGWDWNRYPGTTTIHLPNDKLKAVLNQLPGAGIEEMLLSTEAYSGANRLDDHMAMFAMKLQGHKKYQQQGFTANKSYFIFDNNVIALGSNINSDDPQYPVETTLFQHSVSSLKPIEVNGTPISNLGYAVYLSGEITLQDPAHNYYFISATNEQPLNISYKTQTSNDEDDGKVTTGNFASAVIEHGIQAKNRGYEYAITIDGTEAIKPKYQVLQQDINLHAVEKDGIEAYAFFAPTQVTSNTHVVSAETPMQIIAKPNQQGNELALSIVNPDFAFYKGQDPDQIDENGDQVEVSIYSRPWRYDLSQPVTSIFTVKGHWQLSAPSDKVQTSIDGENTKVTTTTTDAEVLQFGLIAK